jgi:hypothetical protein
MPIFKYEIHIRSDNDNTGECQELVRMEYAYNAIDAVSQAFMVVSATTGSSRLSVISVGPPMADILASHNIYAEAVKSK